MRRVVSPTIIAMLVSACTFSIKFEGTDDAMPADASVTTSDARAIDAALPIDAGPDAMPSWVQIESIVVACDGTEYVSSNTLAANTTYRLRATGECVTNSSNNSRGDAEFAYNMFTNGTSSQGIDMGLAINDTTPDDAKLPSWGSYASSHMYTVMWMGLGAPIIAKFHDPNYDNNSGQLTLYIDSFE